MSGGYVYGHAVVPGDRKRALDHPGAGVTGGPELLNTRSGNQT